MFATHDERDPIAVGKMNLLKGINYPTHAQCGRVCALFTGTRVRTVLLCFILDLTKNGCMA